MKRFLKYALISIQVLVLSCNHNESSVNQKKEVDINSHHKTGSIITINGADLLKLQKLDKKTYIINVSKPNQNTRQCKLIKNYQHIEASEIYKDPSILPKGKTVILISDKGIESLKLANFLKKLGITVYNLQGGLKSYWDWREKVIRDSLHIYDKKIDVIELYEDDFGC